MRKHRTLWLAQIGIIIAFIVLTGTLYYLEADSITGSAVGVPGSEVVFDNQTKGRPVTKDYITGTVRYVYVD